MVLTSTGAGSPPAFEAVSAGTALTGSTNNQVTTVTGANAIVGESNLIFDGSKLGIGTSNIDQELHIEGENPRTHPSGGSANTVAMKIDGAGIVTKPLQPAFILKKGSAQTDVGTAEFDISWETEIVDRNADFGTPSFTAPVTGIYQMDIQIEGVQLDSATNATTQLRLLASNRSFYTVFRNDLQLSADASVDLKLSVMVDMDANDTVKVTMLFANGHTTSDISYSYTHWSGYLVA